MQTTLSTIFNRGSIIYSFNDIWRYMNLHEKPQFIACETYKWDDTCYNVCTLYELRCQISNHRLPSSSVPIIDPYSTRVCDESSNKQTLPVVLKRSRCSSEENEKDTSPNPRKFDGAGKSYGRTWTEPRVYRSSEMDLQFNFVGHPEAPRGWSSVCGERNGVNKELVVRVTISGVTGCFTSNRSGSISLSSIAFHREIIYANFHLHNFFWSTPWIIERGA